MNLISWAGTHQRSWSTLCVFITVFILVCVKAVQITDSFSRVILSCAVKVIWNRINYTLNLSRGSFMQTKHLFVLIHIRIKGEVVTVKHVQALQSSKAVLCLWIICVIYVSRLSLLYCLVCSLQPCDHLLGKGCPLCSLVCDVFLCFVTNPYGVSGQGIDSWSLTSLHKQKLETERISAILPKINLECIPDLIVNDIHIWYTSQLESLTAPIQSLLRWVGAWCLSLAGSTTAQLKVSLALTIFKSWASFFVSSCSV